MIKKGISLHTIEKTWKIDGHTLKNWKSNEDQLKAVNNKDKLFRKNRSGFIFRNFSSTEEEDIFKFIKNARENYKAVSTKSVIAFTCTLKEEFAKKSPLTQLKWCYRFIKRYGLSIRRVTHVGQTIPSNMQDQKTMFFNNVILNKKELDIPPDESYTIINMDETPCYLEIGFN